MLISRLKNIRKVLRSFTGKNGEPSNNEEIYILKSMWVMLCSEFEGCVKSLLENYIITIKKEKNIKDMHVCFLLQNFYGNKEKKEFTINEILNLFKNKKTDITFRNFTKDKKSRYKSSSIECLFNSLGIFFTKNQKSKLKLLDGIASTRDSIAHGDYGISITKIQLEESIKIFKNIYRMLKSKLK